MPEDLNTEGQAPRSAKDYMVITAKGVAMGAADVVPGVSGGTVAFISGIYEELISSLTSIEPQVLTTLFKQGPAAAWRQINGSFLLAVFGGVLFSVLSLAKLISYCLQHYPILLWSFFFGLILASAGLLFKQLQRKSLVEGLSLLMGIAAALAVSQLSPAETEATPLNLFLAGAVAICAMILPGISGAFILLMLGLYNGVITAIKSVDVVAIASFGAGAAVGLVLFSHVLSWLFKRYHSQTLALLTGFLLGSLAMVWPWKQTLSSRINSHGVEIPLLQENISPWAYELLLGQPSYIWLAGVMIIVGISLIGVLDYMASADSRQDVDQ